MDESPGTNPKLNIFAGTQTGIKTISAASGAGFYRRMFSILSYDSNAGETATDAEIRGYIDVSSARLKFQAGTGGQYLTNGDDLRRHSNATSIANAADVVKLLNPVNYTLSSGEAGQGFIAHELQQHAAYAVDGTQNETEAIGTMTDAEGNETTDVTEPEAIAYGASWTQTGTRDVYQGVDRSALVPLLTKALQEALERIEALESQINS